MFKKQHELIEEVKVLIGIMDRLPYSPEALIEEPKVYEELMEQYSRVKPLLFPKFLDLLRSSNIELDCDLIIGDCDMPASFVWNEDCKITDYGIEKFKPIMIAEYTILENGNIEIHCDDYKLGEYFTLAAAGHIGCSEYDRIFGTNIAEL